MLQRLIRFEELFHLALGVDPYPYQRRLAEAKAWPEVLAVPTGLGKTAAVVLAWLWRRRFADAATRQDTPRRLVYCLPMRTLVQQTADQIREWFLRLELLESDDLPEWIGGPRDSARIPVHVLMGGDLAQGWDARPEDDQVIVGTQDQLLSRALNRGYGVSRYRWPMQFSMLNNDCLWVVDEPQLFGDALATTRQLQAFRQQMGTYGPTRTVWMSATLHPDWLRTVDAPDDAVVLRLDDDDRAQARTRLTAAKPLVKAGVSLTERGADHPYTYIQELAQYVQDVHRKGTLTLVVVNRVARAQRLFIALHGAKAASEVQLVHGRFRPGDRDPIHKTFREFQDKDAILVATQAVEAGVDLSATTLVTELAPWPNLVQRFGRCNRDGRATNAQVHWVDIESKEHAALPYPPESLADARAVLQSLTDVSIDRLPDVRPQMEYGHVLRRRDLLALFDTTPDLTGFDIDVSPYVRDAEESDVQVFWRIWDDGQEPPADLPRPDPREVCRVSRRMLRDYLHHKARGKETARKVWAWDPLRRRWREVDRNGIVPGQLLLLDGRMGGYDPHLGFYPDSWTLVRPVPQAMEQPNPPFEAHDQDNDNGPVNGTVVELGRHLLDVAQAAERVRQAFPEVRELSVLAEAARQHDRGKAHILFQTRLRQQAWPDGGAPVSQSQLLAKAPVRRDGTGEDKSQGAGESASSSRAVAAPDDAAPDDAAASRRPDTRSADGFRHELASALAYLADQASDRRNDWDVRLTAYLIAAHHGKVRLHIRSVPTEPVPPDDTLFARGVWDGDMLPSVPLPDGSTLPAATLHLDVMRLGQVVREGAALDSWVLGVERLLDRFGPFRLAWLETLLRVADWRASQEEVDLA
ncbi:type I-G CRISPR-associated helicase/endonuclease Cas3g [Alicyclobacillus macrosporangiidus]|uniref:type I-G CRISPR-associated helicase/endonuclease Cas3g n=1 Tax=Alicyclobacillus macrosporangiidus TaxID=392015 RepID=UPI0009F812CF|nr:CRISPR-associated helicase Cas3' [Alicyclobacillus macrosporangiidus]